MDWWFEIIGTLLLVLVPFLLYIHVETERVKTVEALTKISKSRVIELPADGEVLKPGDIVHGSSRNIISTVTDPALGISIQNALTLDRFTEYCQWREIRRKTCDRCSRTLVREDGTKEIQYYECDCTIQYEYVKGWNPHLINSFLFDQPAAHFNPQRDPMPPSSFMSKDASLNIFSDRGQHSKVHLSPDLLLSRVRGAKPRKVIWVPDGIPNSPPFWSRWIPDRSRYEDLSSLRYLTRFLSPFDDTFTYVGDGYFFSPYDASKMERLMKVFGEYLEGTLFDWQIGDIFPSCTAGDVRIKYMVQDPKIVSILGAVMSTSSGSELTLRSITTDHGFGFVHEGIVNASKMIDVENHRSLMIIVVARFLSMVWAFFSSRRLFHIAGYEFQNGGLFKKMLVTFSFWSFLIGIVLSRVWKSSFEGNLLTSIATILLVILLRDPPHKRALLTPK